jgi:hypothetical protein
VLLGALFVFAICWVDRATGRRQASVDLTALFAVTLVAVGLPWLGAKVGGVLTFAPVAAVALVLLRGARMSWRVAVGAVAAALLALVVATQADLLRPARARSHLALAASEATHTGGQSLATTLGRKADTAVRVTANSHWTIAAVVLGLFAGYVLARSSARDTVAPPGSPRRIFVLAGLAGAGLGLVLNDSGVLVTALALAPMACWMVVETTAATAAADAHSRLTA